jgi:hypothetical protein
MNPEKIFLFNSSLPEHCRDMEKTVRTLGPSMNSVCGRNIGNGYISYAFLKIIFGGPVKVPHLPNAWTDPLPKSLADRINQTCSHFIFVMQDFIREDYKVLPFERISQFLEKIKIPVVPISLGANSFNGYDSTLVSRLDKEQKRFLSIVSEKSAMIGVRGRYTAEVLGQLGIKNVEITGPPTYFESGQTRTVIKSPWNLRRVVTTGSYFNDKLPDSVHVLQDEMYFIDVLFLNGEENRLDPNLEARPFNEYDIPTSLHCHLKARQDLLKFFMDFREWEKFYEDNKWCLTIGSRLHSAIFSCNRGVPAIVTNGDARARESCEHLGIPYRPDLGPNSNIAEEYENLDLSSMNRKYATLHANFAEYLKTHGLQPASLEKQAVCFQFPQIEKPAANKVQEALDRGLTELASFCNDKSRRCREFEELVHLADTRLQAAEERLRELEKFRASKAGRIAAQLQILRHDILHVEHFLISRLKRFPLFRERKKNAA